MIRSSARQVSSTKVESRGAAVAVNAQRLVQQATGDEAWNQFLQMLPRPEVVERPHDYGRQPVGGPVRIDQPVRAALGAAYGLIGMSGCSSFIRSPCAVP